MKQLFLDLFDWFSPGGEQPPVFRGPLGERALPGRAGLPNRPEGEQERMDRGLPSAASLEQLSRQLLHEVGCPTLAGKVCVHWNSRLQTTAGRAHYRETRVVLNPRLIAFGWEEIDRTLRHELAHLLARFRAGREMIAPHGMEWKQACRDLGLLDEKRTHNLPLARRVIKRKHHYRCPNCRNLISRVKPFRARVACLECCRKHGNGRYEERFRLVKE